MSNADLTARAQRVIPGGVNSMYRVVPFPLVITSATGAYFTDADGKQYLDYNAAFGPIILGHNHPRVNAAVRATLDSIDLTGIGVTELEVELAEQLVQLIPGAERVLFATAGSEVIYAALRLARAMTGRQQIIKFQGTYHGWHDEVLLNVLSAPEKIGQRDPLSQGMLPQVFEQTIVLPFNDIEAVTATIEQHGTEIAAVVIEAVAHNMGCVVPQPAFLAALRALTQKYGIVLIFDEVVTGFRHGLGGYQQRCGITPDLSTFAKAMGNGYPIAALVGKQEFMDYFRPGGGVVFAGTFNGHPVGVSAALATIAELTDGSIHQHCFALTEQISTGLQRIAQEVGIPMTVATVGSIFIPYFLEGPITNYSDLLRNNMERDRWFRQAMRQEGIFMNPSPLKRSHISAAHTVSDIEY